MPPWPPALPRPAPRLIAAAGLAVLVAGCDIPATGTIAPPPRAPAAVAGPPVASAESRALAAYYAQVQSSLLSRGLMRTDQGRTDAPFSARMLAENFVRVALYDEYVQTGGGFTARETPSILRRWAAPVRVSLRFGDSVPAARQAVERARVASYLARLSRVTGHSIRLADGAPNFFLYIVDEDERRAMGPQIAAAMPGLSAVEIGAFTGMPPSTYCQVSAVSDRSSGVYVRALAVIRAEHPDLMFLSCLHEEIAQGLGLPNDSPRARPSIFNDDQEFALLTPHDELLLRLLYHPSLRPGMTEAEASPIVESLAIAFVGGES
ncbi:MAG: DUF2927 domain-containing protein [Paracoccaceae bacterium]|nr:MAG: DUF2927 domain-containing protein [Paracoccaceae bacterium]